MSLPHFVIGAVLARAYPSVHRHCGQKPEVVTGIGLDVVGVGSVVVGVLVGAGVVDVGIGVVEVGGGAGRSTFLQFAAVVLARWSVMSC